MVREEEKFDKRLPIGDTSFHGGNMAQSPGNGPAGKKGSSKTPKTFEQLHSSKDSTKSTELYRIFNDLYSGQQSVKQDSLKTQWDLYSGKDEELKESLKKFFGGKEYIYSGMDLNSIIKSIASKIIQPFISKDDIIFTTPTGVDIETSDRVGELLNRQMADEQFLQEAYKVIKDGLIHSIGFMSIGWQAHRKRLPKRSIKKTLNEGATSPEEQFSVSHDTVEWEDIIVERPDFKAEFIGNIYYPKVTRWEELPYLCRRETMSKREFNERYLQTANELDRNDDTNSYKTTFELDREYFPGSLERHGNNAIDNAEVVHFYFSDETYYVCLLNSVQTQDAKQYTGMRIVYQGRSPIPGVAIPVIPYIPEPISGRLEGESTVNVGQNDQRKITEQDNLMMRDMRNHVSAPIIHSVEAGLDIARYMNRTPNEPIQVDGDVNQIKRLELEKMDQLLPQMKEMSYNSLQRTTGQSDFAMGNIGKSARLTGVDSLIGMAMSRLAMPMSQFNNFILRVADAALLANRAYLPIEYGKIASSLYADLPVEILTIPYPMKIKLSTAISGGSDQSIRLGALREAIQLGFQFEAQQPGSVDLMGLTQRFFSEAGLKDVGRYFLQSPMTLNEREFLHAADSILAQQSLAQAQQQQQMMQEQPGQPQPQQGAGLDPTGQAGQIPPLNEQSGRPDIG